MDTTKDTSSSVIHSDPEIVGGTPVFRGTRVPAQTLFDYLEGGETLDRFLDQFPSVSRAQALAALAAHQHEQHDDDGAEQAQRLLPDHPVKEVRKWPASASRFGADAAGVPAQCRQVMGTIHATEIFPIAAPEVSRETARSIADFCRGTTRRE